MDPIKPTAAEITAARDYAASLHQAAAGRRLPWPSAEPAGTEPADRPPFSFTYGGRPAEELLPSWPRQVGERQLEDGRRQSETIWLDPESGLQVRLVAVSYEDFPAVEWTVYLKNTGSRDTPLIGDLQGADLILPGTRDDRAALHSITSDYYSAHGYEPFTRELPAGSEHRFAPDGGRSSNRAFPYFNLAAPGGGLILAVGWPGQWEAEFERQAEGNLRITAGQQQVRLCLRPGEEVRTPLIALLLWAGEDRVRAHNLWRRWLLAHNLPRTLDGQLPPPLLFGGTSLQFNEMTAATEENQKGFITRYLAARVPLDYWWMDAGWYPCHGEWWLTGTWEPDPERFPQGLRAISDFAHERGLQTLLWFEPERVTDGAWLHREHPPWLLSRPDLPAGESQDRLLDLGNPAIDFVQMGLGLGVPSVRATTTADFVTALERALATPGPHLIEAVVPSSISGMKLKLLPRVLASLAGLPAPLGRAIKRKLAP